MMDLIGRRCRYRWENVLVGQKVYTDEKQRILVCFLEGLFLSFFFFGSWERRERGKERNRGGWFFGRRGGVGVMFCVGEEGGMGRSKETREERKEKKKDWQVSHVGYFDLGSRARVDAHGQE